MCADRSLWVDDAYVLRCRGCHKPFTWIRRKHHCRQCGQVFCAGCLYTTPTPLEQWGWRVGLSTSPVQPPSAARKLIAESTKPTKVCHRCAQALVAAQVSGDSAGGSALQQQPGTPTAQQHGVTLPPATAPDSSQPRTFLSPLLELPAAPASPELPSSDHRTEPRDPRNATASTALHPPPAASMLVNTATATEDNTFDASDVPSTVVETPEERMLPLALRAPVRQRRNQLLEWLASVDTGPGAVGKRAEYDTAGGSGSSTPWPTLPHNAGALVLLEMAASPGAAPHASTTFLPASDSPSSLETWQAQCERVLSARARRAVVESGVSGRFRCTEAVHDRPAPPPPSSSPALHDASHRLADLLSTLAVRVLRRLVVPLGGCVTEGVALLLTEEGHTEASEVQHGVSFFASLASRATRHSTVLSDPRFLLLSGDVTCVNEPGLGVLEYMNSYRGHLDNNLKKIARWNPDVVVVERGMHHYLQEQLTKQYPHVVLLLHVGKCHMTRLAQCTGGRLVTDLSFVGLAQLSSAGDTPVGTASKCEIRSVGSRVICLVSDPTPSCYASVLVCGVQRCRASPQIDAAEYAAWRGLWSTVLGTAYHLCAQVHLLRDMGLAAQSQNVVQPANVAINAWTPNLAVAFSPSVLGSLDALDSGKKEQGAPLPVPDRTRRDVLVTTVIEVGALEDTTIALLAENSERAAGFAVRRVLRFYQPGVPGDETLVSFLLSRVESKHSTMLFAHNERAVWVTTTCAERTAALASYECVTTEKEISLFATARPRGAFQGRGLNAEPGTDCPSLMALSEDSVATALAMDPPYCFSSCARCVGGANAVQARQRVTVCSPHALNLSLGALLEFLLYGESSALLCATCGESPFQSQADGPTLSFVLFPPGAAAFTVSFRVAPLAVRPIRFPASQPWSEPEGAPVGHGFVSASDAQERAELVADVHLLAEKTRSLVEHLGDVGGTPADVSTLLKGVASLQAQLTQSMTTREVTACRWTQLQPLLGVYGALATQTSGANAVPELIAPVRWLYSPSAAQAVRWGEPTSLIALALALTQSTTPQRASATAAIAGLSSPFDGASLPKPTRVCLDDLHTASGQHVKPAGDTARVATVEVHLAEAFDALRFLVTNGRPDRVLEALGRCERYQPAGGKSHSHFFRTLDDRLLLKQIRPIELRHFVDVAATGYFHHTQALYMGAYEAACAQQSTPSLHTVCTFGKMLGVFTVTRRGMCLADSSVVWEHEHYMLVENVTAPPRRVLAAYDLKGSQRNRIAAAGATVVLDENLVTQLRKGQYLFVSEADKQRLICALADDTALLASSSIMDYSLVVARTTAEEGDAGETWCIGLIDYMQPYTGVKALESKMKSGLDTVLGYTQRAPTIIDPSRYQHRFLLWMNRYFCAVPTRLSRTEPDAEEVRADAPHGADKEGVVEA